MDNEQVEAKAEMLARNEVLGNQSMLVNWMMQQFPDKFVDEIQNIYQSCEDAATNDEGFVHVFNDEDGNYVFRNEKGIEEYIDAETMDEAWAELCNFRGIEPEQKEVMEWYWIGWSGSFIEQDLQEVGAVLLYHPETDDVWWGRTQTGQPLAYDSDLKEVARRLIART